MGVSADNVGLGDDTRDDVGAAEALTEVEGDDELDAHELAEEDPEAHCEMLVVWDGKCVFEVLPVAPSEALRAPDADAPVGVGGGERAAEFVEVGSRVELTVAHGEELEDRVWLNVARALDEGMHAVRIANTSGAPDRGMDASTVRLAFISVNTAPVMREMRP